MKRKTRRPPWWQLWVLVPVLGILGFLEIGAPLTAIDHKLAEIGIVLLVSGLISLWLHANQAALMNEACDETAWPATYRLFLPGEPGATAEGSGDGSAASDPGPSSQAQLEIGGAPVRSQEDW